MTITLFSTTGDPNGIRHVDKFNWSGFGVVFSKDQLANLKGHPVSGIQHLHSGGQRRRRDHLH